jgi:argininosuccinate lyase
LADGFLDATALVEYLVRKGVPFRQAHGIVGSLIVDCEKHNITLAEVSLERFKKYSAHIDEDVYEYLGAKNVVSKYITEGAAGPKQAERQIAYWHKHLSKR